MVRGRGLVPARGLLFLGQYLGIGLSYADTRAVYASLFGNASG